MAFIKHGHIVCIVMVFSNPIALRKAKIVYTGVYNFGLSECNRVKHDAVHRVYCYGFHEGYQ